MIALHCVRYIMDRISLSNLYCILCILPLKCMRVATHIYVCECVCPKPHACTSTHTQHKLELCTHTHPPPGPTPLPPERESRARARAESREQSTNRYTGVVTHMRMCACAHADI